jgi:mannose-1-phosphate guanylyltransferase / mannose-6-phosphate isomerase
VTFAVRPTNAATGFGYLKLGNVIDTEKQQFNLDAFVEKPTRKKAEEFLLSGQYAWNSGMFMFKVGVLLKNFAILAPEILGACQAAMPLSMLSSTVVLDKTIFPQAPSISIDYAIMEKALKVVTIVGDLGWSDVDDWSSVWQASVKDSDGVVARGNVHSIHCKDTLIKSDGPLIVGLGLDKMIAIATKDAIFVGPLSRSQDMKLAVDALVDLGRREATSTKIINKPGVGLEISKPERGFKSRRFP